MHAFVPTLVKGAGLSETNLVTPDVAKCFVTSINYSRMGLFAIEFVKNNIKRVYTLFPS